MKNNMYEVAVALAPKQTELIDYLTEDSVLVKEMPFQPATHGLKNVFEKVKEVKAPTLVDLDSPMPLVTAVTELGETPLFKLGGTLEMPKDKVNAMGGKEVYLRRKLPMILKVAGAALDTSIYYNVMIKKNLENKKAININPEASGKNYWSLCAIRYSMGENCGLYNDNRTNGAKEGDFFTDDPLWGGNLGKLTHGETGWATDLTSMIGIQLENPKYMQAMVNIDEAHLPTYKQLIGIANAIRGNANNARIYMNPDLIDLIASKYSRASGNDSFSNMIVVDENGAMRIKGIPVIGDWNILSGEEDAIPAEAFK